MTHRRIGALACALAFLLLAGGCGSSSPSAPKQLTVATSTDVLADLIGNVAGDQVTIVRLVPDGQSPLRYEANPRDAVALSGATVFFENGLSYEGQLRQIIASSRVRVVTLSKGLVSRQTTIGHGDHEHLFSNPYFYLDVQNAMSYVEQIRDTLVEIDPPNADTYRTNASRYLAELADLDKWIEGEVRRIPEGNRRLMKDHASFPYYADRYGLLDYAASYEGTSETAPAPSQYATLIGQVREWGVRAVFGEAGYSSKLMQQLAQDTNTTFVDGLRTVTLGPEPANTYIGMMRENTRIIVGALS